MRKLHNDRYKVYKEDLDTGNRVFICNGFGSVNGLIDLFSDECEVYEQIVLVPICN